MKKKLIFLALIILTLIPFTLAANDFAYNRLYDGSQPIDGFNYSINVNSSNWWDTSTLGPLRTASATQFNNVGGTLTIDVTHFDLRWCELTGCTMSGDIDMNGNSLLNALNINGTGDIMMTRSTPGISLINAMSTNPIGLSAIRADSDSGSFASLVSIGSQFPGANTSANDSGIIAGGGRLIFVNNGLEDIAFAHVASGDSNFSNATFSFRLNVAGDAFLSGDLFLEDDQKSIRTVAVDGGSAIVLDSNDTIVAGGFPVIEVAKTAQGDRVVTRWSQNGRNNSFSGAMNTFGTVPRSWVNFTGETDSEGIEFLFNRSDYIQYCNYLQDNLSLIPEGCQYFADTTSRLVPLLFGGDLEVHRSAVIHEGLTVFNSFDFIGRGGNDANFFFNNEAGGAIHGRDNRNVLANITDFDNVVCNFDDATLCDFYLESIAPEAGRDWDSVLENECHEDRCANAKGGNEKVMAVDSVTLGATDINISFWLSSVFVTLDSLEIEVDDNQGNVTTVFTETTSVVDTLFNVSLPAIYENKLNVTTRFILNGQNANREVWIDIVRVTATLDPSVIINESYEGGRLVLGEDRGSLSCAVDVNKVANNDTFGTEWVMDLGSPDCRVNFVGNVTFTDSTVINQTVIGDLNVTGTISEGGELLSDKYFLVNGSSTMQGNTNSPGFNATYDYLFGNGSQLTGLPETDISGLVPYLGATGDVDLGEFDLEAKDVRINRNLDVTGRIRNSGEFNFGPDKILWTGEEGLFINGGGNFAGDWNITGDLTISTDNDKLFVGDAGSRGSFYQDGIDTVINPKEAGSGLLKVLGDLTATGNVTADYFLGDGSQLTGIIAGDVFNNTDGKYNFSMMSSYDWATTGKGTFNDGILIDKEESGKSSWFGFDSSITQTGTHYFDEDAIAISGAVILANGEFDLSGSAEGLISIIGLRNNANWDGTWNAGSYSSLPAEVVGVLNTVSGIQTFNAVPSSSLFEWIGSDANVAPQFRYNVANTELIKLFGNRMRVAPVIQGSQESSANLIGYGDHIEINLDTTGTSTAYGLYIESLIADTTYGIYNDAGADNYLGGDNSKTYWGTGKDASTYYDNTDLVINPKEAGSGKLKVLGDLNVTGNITAEVYAWGGASGGYITSNATCWKLEYKYDGTLMEANCA